MDEFELIDKQEREFCEPKSLPKFTVDFWGVKGHDKKNDSTFYKQTICKHYIMWN